MKRLCSLAVLCGALAASTALVSAGPRFLQLRDLRAQVTLSDAQISPDGKNVLLIARRQNFVNDRLDGHIVLVDVATGVQIELTRVADRASSPRWSPDGKQIAFITKWDADDPKTPGSGKQQIHVLPVGGGSPRAVTAAVEGVSSFAWSPDGRSFAFLAGDEAPNKKQLDAKDDGFHVGDNEWTFEAAPVPDHLWTIAVDGTGMRRLTQGAWTASGEPAWAPDGRSIFIDRYPTLYREHYNSERLVRIDLRDGSMHPVADGIGRPAFAPTHARMAYDVPNPLRAAGSLIAISRLDGSQPIVATAKLDRDDSSFAFAPDGSLLVSANDATRTRIFRVTSPSGDAHALPLGDANVTSAISVARDGSIAFFASTPSHPSELYVLRPGATSARRLTSFNDYVKGITFGVPRTIAWRSADGFSVDGVLTEPAGGLAPGKRYPLVLVIHGGPTGASTTGFDSLAQLMAARGWLVFEPNYRGSNNMGAKFAQATVPHITSAPAQDVEDGLAAVLKLGIVDETRIGVSGWSEGGLLTSWLITHDTRWKAAMSGAAVNDWLMYADLTDAQDFTPIFMSADSPWTSAAARALYIGESPLTYADKVKTPTLIMTDAGDQRVPEPLAYAFYHAIRAAGTPVTMVVIPVDGHFPGDPVRREDVSRRWVEWFATHF
jgi:dipeptidyl aminopeptidase/acylaminoacyl peptidase